MNDLIKGLLFLIPIILFGSSRWEKPIGSSPQDTKNIMKYHVPVLDGCNLINLTPRDDMEGWAIEGNDACAGCYSFFWKIVRSKTQHIAENGNYYYYYYIYFYSNSYYSDGSIASTYISDISILLNNKEFLRIPYILIPPEKVVLVVWIRSKNLSENIDFSITNINVY